MLELDRDTLTRHLVDVVCRGIRSRFFRPSSSDALVTCRFIHEKLALLHAASFQVRVKNFPRGLKASYTPFIRERWMSREGNMLLDVCHVRQNV